MKTICKCEDFAQIIEKIVEDFTVLCYDKINPEEKKRSYDYL